MKSRVILLIALIAFAISVGVSLWAWGQVPDGTQIPIHWGIDGEANGYAPKLPGLFLLPALIAVMGVVFVAIPYLDPRRENQERSSVARVWILGAGLVVMCAVHVAAVLTVVGAPVDIGRVVVVAVGLMFIVIGNYLGKTRSNWFVGIRTPWTLSSERSWDRTHRLGGYLFVAAGLISMVLGLAAPPELSAYGMLVAVGVVAVVSILYSYFAWRSDPDRRSLGG